MGANYGSSFYTVVDGLAWTTAEINAITLGGNLNWVNGSNTNIREP